MGLECPNFVNPWTKLNFWWTKSPSLKTKWSCLNPKRLKLKKRLTSTSVDPKVWRKWAIICTITNRRAKEIFSRTRVWKPNKNLKSSGRNIYICKEDREEKNFKINTVFRGMNIAAVLHRTGVIKTGTGKKQIKVHKLTHKLKRYANL